MNEFNNFIKRKNLKLKQKIKNYERQIQRCLIEIDENERTIKVTQDFSQGKK